MNRTSLKECEDQYYQTRTQEIKNLLKQFTSLAATTDGWTNKITRKSFLSLTIHYLKKDWTPDSIGLGIYHIEGEHTATNLAKKIVNVFDWFEICRKVDALVADHAPNMCLLSKKLDLYYHMMKSIVAIVKIYWFYRKYSNIFGI